MKKIISLFLAMATLFAVHPIVKAEMTFDFFPKSMLVQPKLSTEKRFKDYTDNAKAVTEGIASIKDMQLINGVVTYTKGWHKFTVAPGKNGEAAIIKTYYMVSLYDIKRNLVHSDETITNATAMRDKLAEVLAFYSEESPRVLCELNGIQGHDIKGGIYLTTTDKFTFAITHNFASWTDTIKIYKTNKDPILPTGGYRAYPNAESAIIDGLGKMEGFTYLCGRQIQRENRRDTYILANVGLGYREEGSCCVFVIQEWLELKYISNEVPGVVERKKRTMADAKKLMNFYSPEIYQRLDDLVNDRTEQDVLYTKNGFKVTFASESAGYIVRIFDVTKK